MQPLSTMMDNLSIDVKDLTYGHQYTIIEPMFPGISFSIVKFSLSKLYFYKKICINNI